MKLTRFIYLLFFLCERENDFIYPKFQIIKNYKATLRLIRQFDQ